MLQIVEESERVGALADIERDILLAELREAYTELKFGEERSEEIGERSEEMGESSEEIAEPIAEEPAVAELPITPIAPITPIDEGEDNDEPEVEVELIFEEEDECPFEMPTEEEPAEEEVTEEEPTVAELPIAPSTPTTPTTPTSKRSALLSLYEDNPTPVLGEQFHETPSVADTIACPKGVAESTPVASLREAIGLADKFMLIRELFGGDAEAYDKAISELDEQPSFDDCIIYIAEHYTWSPNAESTKMVMELLQRKYN